jgi:hypothetical protein
MIRKDARILIALICCFLISLQGHSQKASTQASEYICACIEKRLPDTKPEHARDSVNKCFGEAMAIHHAELQKEFRLKEITVESIRYTA